MDIGFVQIEESISRLEDKLRGIGDSGVAVARLIFPGETERAAMTLLERYTDGEDPSFLLAAWNGYAENGEMEQALFRGDVRLSNSMSGTVLKRQASVILNSLWEMDSQTPYYPLNKDICSAMGAPIVYCDQIFGALCVESTLPNRFSQEDARKLEILAIDNGLKLSIYRDAITNFRTGVYNSNFHMKQMEVETARSLAEGIPLGLLIIDVDSLKLYNTAYGLRQGNVMLRNVASVIKRDARPQDFPTRYGGDEFSVIMPGATKDECIEVGKTIKQGVENLGLQHPLAPSDLKLLTVSVGVAHSTDPGGVSNIEDLASYCVNIAKNGDGTYRNTVVYIANYGPELNSRDFGVRRYHGMPVQWTALR